MSYTIGITIGNYTFNDANLKSLEISDALINDSSISVGNTGASTYTIQLYNINYDGQANNVNNIVVGESIVINITDNNTSTTTQIAKGSVTELEKDGILTTVKGADAMITILGKPLELSSSEIESLKQSATFSVNNLKQLIDSKFGVSVTLPNIVTDTDFDMSKFEGFVDDILTHKPTGRELVGMIAGLGCANAYIDPTGTGRVVSMAQLPDSYQATYTINPSITYRFSTAMCSSKINAININDAFYSASTQSNGQYNLIVDVDNELLKYLEIPAGEANTYNYTEIWEYLNGLNYIGFEATCPGDTSVKVGDCVLIVDTNGNQQQSIVFSITTKYDGAYTRTYSARTAKTTTYEINKGITKTSDSSLAKTILEEGTETNEAIKKVAGGGGGMPLEGLEMFTELKTWALKYNSSLDRWLFVSGSLPASMTAVIFTSEGTAVYKKRVTFAQPLSDTDTQGNTYYYYAAANTQSVTVNGSPLYFTSSDFNYADTGQQTTEYPVKIPVFDSNYNEVEFDGIFAKEITAVADMYSSDYATGDVGYILEAVT